MIGPKTIEQMLDRQARVIFEALAIGGTPANEFALCARAMDEIAEIISTHVEEARSQGLPLAVSPQEMDAVLTSARNLGEHLEIALKDVRDHDNEVATALGDAQLPSHVQKFVDQITQRVDKYMRRWIDEPCPQDPECRAEIEVQALKWLDRAAISGLLVSDDQIATLARSLVK